MTSGHATPASGDREQLLYDVTVATPSHAERARTLLASQRTATLSTVAEDPPGHPYGSFVTYAEDGGQPVLLVSSLAEHTRHLRADPRASLLAAESRSPDPLANGRVTLVGSARRAEPGAERDRCRELFLTAHPNAAFYASFGDFDFWRLDVASARYIGGYGRMSWVDRDAYLAARPDPLAPHADAAIAHVNADHADVLVLCARAFSRAADASAAVLTAIDRYGFEMSVTTSAGLRPVRLAWDAEALTVDDVRREFVALAARARRSR